VTAPYTAAAARAAADAIASTFDGRKPDLAIILGSGLGGLSRAIKDGARVSFRHIPGFPDATVAGHEGAVITGKLGGREVLALSGRFHLYEGHPAALAAFPVRVFHALGINQLFVSNAAGGISEKLGGGDLMIISDHLNLMGANPLVGAAQEGETRFPDMTEAYDPGLRKLLRSAAKKLSITIHEGVYAALLGPSYETPSEVKMLRTLGADAVGMSTVPEVIMARALGMQVAGVSCITNPAAGVTGAVLSHADVLEMTQRVAQSFEALVTEFAQHSANQSSSAR
jgi:purine-nucleoside phosphorylase